jgi:RND superfamily putative drug exporter
VGTGVFGKLAGGGFEDPSSESAVAAARLEEAFGRGGADVVVLYRSTDRTVDDPTFRRDVEAALEGLPAGSVTTTATYWSTGAPTFVSQDRRSTFAVLGLPGDDDEALEEAYAVVADRLDAAGLETSVGGSVAGEVTTNEQVGEDIARAELLSLPVLAVLLVVVFGGLVAAGLPLLVGVFSVLGAFLVLHALSYATELSVFALNIVTLLGLGLAIDYSLFMVSRFREELAAGRSVPDAVEHTVATAGRTVAFSGLIVTVSLAGLLLFPQMFLQSMGLGGMAAVTVAAVTSLTVLPAVLGMLGERVNALRLPFLRRRAGSGAFWGRLARAVLRRPVAVMVSTIGLLLLLGLPFLRIEFGTVDARSAARRQRGADRRRGPAVRLPGAVDVPARARGRRQHSRAAGVRGGARGGAGCRLGDRARGAGRRGRADRHPARRPAVRRGARHAGRRTGAPRTRRRAGPGRRHHRRVRRPQHQPRRPPARRGAAGRRGDARAAVPRLRLGRAAGQGGPGQRAVAVGDVRRARLDLPGRQPGRPARHRHRRPIESTQPILILALAFGLSMDYEVFLLSRIREQWDLTGDNALAVETGLRRTGGLITSAAVLFMVVVGAFATSGVVFIQMIGVGLVLAVAIDATLVRGLLVPSAMQLMGSANWWAPKPLQRVYDRFGLRESTAPAPAALPTDSVPAQDARSTIPV